jgi:hypothetical protein
MASWSLENPLGDVGTTLPVNSTKLSSIDFEFKILRHGINSMSFLILFRSSELGEKNHKLEKIITRLICK